MAPRYGVLTLLLLSSALALPRSGWTEGTLHQDREIPTMTVPELIRYWGYDVEEHFVTTSDGYIIGLHRIPASTRGNKPGAGRPVMLAHGLTSSSSQWVFGPPPNSLGYLLHDEGYDVWIHNVRGNTYSRNHTHLDSCSSCAEFWNFCWHEGGTQDYPAVIDYILLTTAHEQLFIVGHSMGTTQLLVMLSEKPEYNDKVIAGFLLAPAAIMTNAYNPIFILTDLAEVFEDILHWLGFYEFLPHPDLVTWLGHVVCNEEEHPIYTEVCGNIGFLLLGIHPDQLNKTMIPVYLDHIPAGTSTRPFIHYAQLHKTDKFVKFDFGSEEENQLHYGSPIPPDYDLSRVTAPLALFSGELDDLATPQDVSTLASLLPNVFHHELLDYPKCTHTDFAIGIDAAEIIYKPILTMMSDF